MATIRSLALAIVMAVAVTGAAGCGLSPSDTPSAKDLYAQARSAALSAKSARMTGTIEQSGEKIKINLAGTVNGSNQKVVLTIPEQGTLTLLTVKKKLYLKGDKTYWTKAANAKVAKAYAGKWVQVAASKATDFGDLTITTVLTGMFKDKALSTLASIASNVDKGTVAGVPAYIITSKFDKSGHLSVTADGSARLLQISSTGTSSGALTFSDWNAIQAFRAPKASQVIKL